jgi:hypothetical protein
MGRCAGTATQSLNPKSLWLSYPADCNPSCHLASYGRKQNTNETSLFPQDFPSFSSTDTDIYHGFDQYSLLVVIILYPESPPLDAIEPQPHKRGDSLALDVVYYYLSLHTIDNLELILISTCMDYGKARHKQC